jgi:hypothetical protein
VVPEEKNPRKNLVNEDEDQKNQQVKDENHLKKDQRKNHLEDEENL